MCVREGQGLPEGKDEKGDEYEDEDDCQSSQNTSYDGNGWILLGRLWNRDNWSERENQDKDTVGHLSIETPEIRTPLQQRHLCFPRVK